MAYLGLSTVVSRSHPEQNNNQSYVIPGGNPDGGDQYTGLDRFGRVVEQRWGLDGVGNWASFTNDGFTQTRTHNLQNQITAISGTATPTYDNNGNTTQDDTVKFYTYDAWNRLVKVAAGANATVYAYDAMGRRISITLNSNLTTDLDYSSNWQVIEDDYSGFMQKQYVWSPAYMDGLVEEDYGGFRYYAQQDANWNVPAIGPWRFAYDPYGKGTMYHRNWNIQGGLSSSFPYAFQGGRYDT